MLSPAITVGSSRLTSYSYLALQQAVAVLLHALLYAAHAGAVGTGIASMN
jgi:hypothetical protein